MKNLNSTLIFFLFLSVGIWGCSEESGPGSGNAGNGGNNPPSANEWLIDQSLVFDGGPGKDGIPSIDNPQFTAAGNVDYLNDNNLVLGIRIRDDIKAYPHPILDWNEIVNDRIGDQSIALTYCPLTGTGIGWNRVMDGEETTFGVSGLLYNSNLMPYDRESNSTWSQQRLDCVNGAKLGDTPQLHTFVETTWGTWKSLYPNSQVLNRETGSNRDYNRYPYGNYRSDNSNLLFPITNEDDRLSKKERVLGVFVDGAVRGYPFDREGTGTEIIRENFNGQNLLIVRNTEKNFIVAYIDPDPSLAFAAVDNSSASSILMDGSGVPYDLLGLASDGATEQLLLADQFIGYWFSWGTFYPEIQLYQ